MKTFLFILCLVSIQSQAFGQQLSNKLSWKVSEVKSDNRNNLSVGQTFTKNDNVLEWISNNGNKARKYIIQQVHGQELPQDKDGTFHYEAIHGAERVIITFQNKGGKTSVKIEDKTFRDPDALH